MCEAITRWIPPHVKPTDDSPTADLPGPTLNQTFEIPAVQPRVRPQILGVRPEILGGRAVAAVAALAGRC
jgi:hypothetical protein